MYSFCFMSLGRWFFRTPIFASTALRHLVLLLLKSRTFGMGSIHVAPHAGWGAEGDP